MTVPKIMPQIEHVVVLMLENRSFDNVVGWLYRSETPPESCPPGSSPGYDGLNTGQLLERLQRPNPAGRGRQ